jgi:hypothetical protein
MGAAHPTRRERFEMTDRRVTRKSCTKEELIERLAGSLLANEPIVFESFGKSHVFCLSNVECFEPIGDAAVIWFAGLECELS